MSYLGYSSISVRGIEALQSIEDLEVNITSNKHAYMIVKGIVNDEIGSDYLENLLEDKEVQVVNISEQEKIIFAGIIVDARIEEKNGVFYLWAKCMSGTFKLDLEKKSRSFQDTKLTYEQLIKEVIKDTPDSDAIFTLGKEKINIPIIQYSETDWEFIKRMVSHFKSIIVPEVTSIKPRFWFGMPEGTRQEVIKNIDYKVWKDIDKFKFDGGQASGYNLENFQFYEIVTWQDFNVGDKLIFKGRQMSVCSKKGKMEKGLWVYTYTLGSEVAVGIKKKYNNLISGMSIKGKVLDTKSERLKIHLDIDKEQDKDTAFWYPYVPTSGNLMYCMPKIGTEAVLYFKDEKEENARITSCIRKNGAVCNDTSDSNNRFFTTEHNKKMGLTPDALFLQGIGNMQSPLMINLQQGISLESHKLLSIVAKGNIEFKSDKKIKVTALADVNIGKVDSIKALNVQSGIKISFEVNIKTGTVKINTTKFVPFKPFEDVPKKFDTGGFWRNVLIAAVAVAAVAVVTIATFGVGTVAIGAIAGATIAVGFKLHDDWKTGNVSKPIDIVAKVVAGAVAGGVGSFGGTWYACIASGALGNTLGMVAEWGISNQFGLNLGKKIGLPDELCGDVSYDGVDFAVGGISGGAGGFLGWGTGKVINTISTKVVQKMDEKAVNKLVEEVGEGFANKLAKNGDKAYTEIYKADRPNSATEKLMKLWKLKLEDSILKNDFDNLTKYGSEETARTLTAQLKNSLGKNATKKALYKTLMNDKNAIGKLLDAKHELVNPLFNVTPYGGGDALCEQSGRWMGSGLDSISRKKPKEVESDDLRYLVRGGLLQCNCGSNNRLINLPLCHGTYVDDNPVLCEFDNVPQAGEADPVDGKNITIFGACTSPTNPSSKSVVYAGDKDGKVDRKGNKITKRAEGKECCPVILKVWQKVKSNILVNNAAILTTDSWLQCKYGGCIRIVNCGQKITNGEK